MFHLRSDRCLADSERGPYGSRGRLFQRGNDTDDADKSTDD